MSLEVIFELRKLHIHWVVSWGVLCGRCKLMTLLLMSLLWPISAHTPSPIECRNNLVALHRAATAHRVPYKLVYAIAHVESHFNSRAISSTGDVGLMQISPGNAKRMNVNKKCLEHASCNAMVGAKILSYMKRNYGQTSGWECRYNIGTKLSQHGTACKAYLEKLKAAGYKAALPDQTYKQRGYRETVQ